MGSIAEWADDEEVAAQLKSEKRRKARSRLSAKDLLEFDKAMERNVKLRDELRDAWWVAYEVTRTLQQAGETFRKLRFAETPANLSTHFKYWHDIRESLQKQRDGLEADQEVLWSSLIPEDK